MSPPALSSIASIIEVTAPLVQGDAPEWVRGGWFGCEMPCEPECGHVPAYVESVLPSTRKGPLTIDEFRALRTGDWKIDGFSVQTDIALQVLECHSPSAAQWFREQGYPKRGIYFRFKLSETKVLRRLTVEEDTKLGSRTVYDDMETGTTPLATQAPALAGAFFYDLHL